MAAYAQGDIVTIAGCSVSGSLINNGEFKISDITSQAITLVNKNTDANIVTGTDATDCKISRAAASTIDITFSESITATACLASQFSLEINSDNNYVPASMCSVSGSIVTLRVASIANLNTLKIKYAKSNVASIADDVITISSVTADGKYTTAAGTGTISAYAQGDIVTIADCSDGGSSGNIGVFEISLIDNTNDITLIDKDSGAPISTGTIVTDCKISRAATSASEKIRDTSGNNNELADISTGQTVTNNVPDTTAPTVSSIITTAAVADSVLTITGITSNGIYSVTGTIASYSVNDLIAISGCSDTDSSEIMVYLKYRIKIQDRILIHLH